MTIPQLNVNNGSASYSSHITRSGDHLSNKGNESDSLSRKLKNIAFKLVSAESSFPSSPGKSPLHRRAKKGPVPVLPEPIDAYKPRISRSPSPPASPSKTTLPLDQKSKGLPNDYEERLASQPLSSSFDESDSYKSFKKSKDLVTPIMQKKGPLEQKDGKISNHTATFIPLHLIDLSLADERLKNLPEELITFLKDHSQADLLDAITAKKHQIVTIGYYVLVFTPSGKVYVANKKIGGGAFKDTFISTLIAFTSLEQIKKDIQHRALSLTKDNLSTRLLHDEQALKNEKDIHLYLKAQSKTHDLSNISVAKSVFDSHNQVGIMTELCEGDIDSLLGKTPLSTSDFYFLAAQMAKGVHQLHEVGIVHRDLKPDNFLFDLDENGKPKTVKVTDFGSSSRLQEEYKYEAEKYPFRYIDPDWHVADYKGINLFSKESDIYQLGVTFYQMIKGLSVLQMNTHFDNEAIKLKKTNDPTWNPAKTLTAEESRTIMQEFKKQPMNWEGIQEIQDKDVKDFILRMLSSDLSNRPTANEVATFFNKRLLQLQA